MEWNAAALVGCSLSEPSPRDVLGEPRVVGTEVSRSTADRVQADVPLSRRGVAGPLLLRQGAHPPGRTPEPEAVIVLVVTIVILAVLFIGVVVWGEFW